MWVVERRSSVCFNSHRLPDVVAVVEVMFADMLCAAAGHTYTQSVVLYYICYTHAHTRYIKCFILQRSIFVEERDDDNLVERLRLALFFFNSRISIH